jgi:hypothetical protein
VVPDPKPAADEAGRASSTVKTARTKPTRPGGSRRSANRTDGEKHAAANREFPARTKPNGGIARNPCGEMGLVRRGGESWPTIEPNLHEAPRPVVPYGAGMARGRSGMDDPQKRGDFRAIEPNHGGVADRRMARRPQIAPIHAD